MKKIHLNVSLSLGFEEFRINKYFKNIIKAVIQNLSSVKKNNKKKL